MNQLIQCFETSSAGAGFDRRDSANSILLVPGWRKWTNQHRDLYRREAAGLGTESFTLEDHLTAMGRRINSIRTSRHMTQQELAHTSGLDRTYISMVERGKQNLTIGAVLRIADALGVPIGHLIEPEAG